MGEGPIALSLLKGKFEALFLACSYIELCIMVAPSALLAILMYHVDQEFHLFGRSESGKTMEHLERLREACQKICRLLGSRMLIEPLQKLWCDLTTLRNLVRHVAVDGSNPLMWTDLPEPIIAKAESIPLRAHSYSFASLWDQKWKPLAVNELQSGKKVLAQVAETNPDAQAIVEPWILYLEDMVQIIDVQEHIG